MNNKDSFSMFNDNIDIKYTELKTSEKSEFKTKNNKNEKYFFSGPDQSICQEYVYTGFYSAEDLCKGRSFQLQISYQWTHLFFTER